MKGTPSFVFKPGPLSTEGLGDEKPVGGPCERARWMELDVLHVYEPRAGTVGHGEAVSRSYGRVCRVQIYPPSPPVARPPE
jgi:hypothetical protein